jgi:hypothetical protein
VSKSKKKIEGCDALGKAFAACLQPAKRKSGACDGDPEKFCGQQPGTVVSTCVEFYSANEAWLAETIANSGDWSGLCSAPSTAVGIVTPGKAGAETVTGVFEKICGVVSDLSKLSDSFTNTAWRDFVNANPGQGIAVWSNAGKGLSPGMKSFSVSDGKFPSWLKPVD